MDHRMRRSLALLLLLFFQHAQPFIPGADGPVTNQEGLEGGNATLFCNSATDESGDELMLLVWYRDNAPVYSFDARTTSEWSSETFNDTGRVSITLQPQPTALLITKLREDDEALYHCRVDFLLTPTRNIGVNLSVTVLPSTPFFLDEVGNKVGRKVGPYLEGDTLVLSCLVIGGRPPPRITWYSRDVLVDASDGASEVPGVKENELYLPLTRDTAGPLSCRASNTDLTQPIVAEVQIELYLAAVNVTIEWLEGVDGWGALSAGRGAAARCSAGGARPAPALAWWLDHRHLTGRTNQSWFPHSSTAVSILQLTPTAAQHGATLSCISTSELLPPERASRADVITLNVTYSPIIEVTKIGSGRMNEVIELDTLHLECEIRANPPVDKIEWYFNDRKIHSGEGWGSDTGSSSLVVTEASRDLAGLYACAARNSHGETRAQQLNITVFYKPECILTGITLSRETIHCNVHSLPPPDAYFWHITPSGLETQQLTTGAAMLPLSQITGPLSEPLHVTCAAENGIASQERVCEKTVSLKHLRPPQPQQCDLAFEYEEFQMRCIPVENATHYEMSVWRMSSSNTSLMLERRDEVVRGVGAGTVQARGGEGTAQVLGGEGAGWLVRAALGQLRAGDEAGAAACNRYGCSRDLLLRPTDNLLYAAAPPWWHVFLDKEVGISLGAVVLVAVFLMSSYLAVQVARRGRSKSRAPVVQVLQLDHVAREYLQALDHKRSVGVACSIRSCSSGYSGGSRDLDLDAPAVDRLCKPPFYWDAGPPPDVTLTLARESAV